MARILVSWLAYQHDFLRREGIGPMEVSATGPTAGVHREFWKQESTAYDRHVLLSQSTEERGDPRLVALVKYLQSNHPDHPVKGAYMGVRDVIDVREIREKAERLLLSLRGDEVDVFISPGTPAMQTAWYLLALGHRIRLFQVRPADKSASGRAEQVYVAVERAPEAAALALREEAPATPAAEAPYIPASLEHAYTLARRAAQTDRVTVIITGESGTGKERLARHVHRESARRDGPFQALNCASMQETLLESRLFGYKKGAFSGADKDTDGLVTAAEGGTLFLDEIGDVSPAFQATLLRLLQEREYVPLGATAPVKADVRIVAATHRDLPALCEAERFRWDLYYRLAVVELELPPLRQWAASEANALMNRLMEEKATYFRRAPLSFSPEARALLRAYTWPGNIRELENTIERLYVTCEGAVDASDLPRRLRHPPADASLRLEDVVRAHVQRVLVRFGGNKLQTAQALGVAYNTLQAKLRPLAD